MSIADKLLEMNAENTTQSDVIAEAMNLLAGRALMDSAASKGAQLLWSYTIPSTAEATALQFAPNLTLDDYMDVQIRILQNGDNASELGGQLYINGDVVAAGFTYLFRTSGSKMLTLIHLIPLPHVGAFLFDYAYNFSDYNSNVPREPDSSVSAKKRSRNLDTCLLQTFGLTSTTDTTAVWGAGTKIEVIGIPCGDHVVKQEQQDIQAGDWELIEEGRVVDKLVPTYETADADAKEYKAMFFDIGNVEYKKIMLYLNNNSSTMFTMNTSGANVASNLVSLSGASMTTPSGSRSEPIWSSGIAGEGGYRIYSNTNGLPWVTMTGMGTWASSYISLEFMGDLQMYCQEVNNNGNASRIVGSITTDNRYYFGSKKWMKGQFCFNLNNTLFNPETAATYKLIGVRR